MANVGAITAFLCTGNKDPTEWGNERCRKEKGPGTRKRQ